MTHKWKDKIKPVDPAQMPVQTNIPVDPNLMTFGDMKSFPPRQFIEKYERWCPKSNAEYCGRGKNFLNFKNQKALESVLKAIKKFKNEFTIRDIIRTLNAEHLTDGSLQRRVLSYLVCKGIINKKRIEINKKDEKLKKPKYLFTIVKEPKECEYLKLITFTKGRLKGKQKLTCTLDWTNESEETRYFDENDDGELF
ncbi:MAG: hypothetical protein PHD81_04675 [Candidatus Nanoarchaeia archaeon]|nr:hypothetical protein [Candidatus Nanoarchaeia archaeon]MDD5588371.1 hypothetical protein [Candidatus Nanoarchaeia archaeon]